MILLVLFSFLAGVVTVLSPCILPILPIILTSSIGGQQLGKSRPLGVVAGFVASFTFFTLFLSTIVRLSGISADALRLVSVFVIAGFGVSLLVPGFQLVIEKLFASLASYLPSGRNKTGFSGGFLIGLSIGLLWTPCVGPILASVISLAITGTVTFDAFLITLAYSLGTAIPMFLIILGGQNVLTRVPWLVSRLGLIQKIFGLLMILTAVGIYYNVDRRFQTYILNTFPSYGTGLTKLEDNSLIRNQLDKQSGSTQSHTIGKPMFDVLAPKGVLAPELILSGTWFNSSPLSMQELRGKVVLIDFWTYSCINCQRTFPYLRDWHEKYKDQGLVIIGVHAPEFEFEKSEANLKEAISDFGLSYPIMQDNGFATWKAYRNRYWPAKYFIDKDGYIRHQHFGEGKYDESERVIQELLKETGMQSELPEIRNPAYQIQAKTHEIYLGHLRIEGFESRENIVKDALSSYTAPQKLSAHSVAFSGDWIVMPEYANPQKGAQLFLDFESKEVFLVMRAKTDSARVKVYVDDKLQYFGADSVDGVVTVTKDTLYKIVTLPVQGRHLLRLEFEDDSIELFAFTFG